MNPAERLASELEAGIDGMGERIVRQFLDVWDHSPTREQLLALMRSAHTDERSAAIFSEYIHREIVARLADAVPDADAQLRAELLVSHLIGLALARFVTRLEPLASTPADTVAAWVGPILQLYLTGPRPAGQ